MQNTIDVDYNPKHGKDKHYARMIIDKIARKKCCGGLSIFPSSMKGTHILINCLKQDCYLCRFVFDDQERFRKDMQRPRYARNVLFQIKNQTLYISRSHSLKTL